MNRLIKSGLILVVILLHSGPVLGQIYTDQDTMRLGGQLGNPGVSGEPGDTVDVYLYMANPNYTIGGYQIKVLYDGSVMTAIGGQCFGRGCVLETFQSNLSNMNFLVAIGYSWSSNTMSPGFGSVAVIQFEIDPEAELGVYPLEFSSNEPDIVNAWTDSLGNNLIIPIIVDGYVNIGLPSGCDYAVGNVNGIGGYDGLDITYGVNYFKGGPEPMCPAGSCPIPPCDTFFFCGDVNGSCSYDGLDITYGVAYFKGGSAPSPCPDCPPTE